MPSLKYSKAEVIELKNHPDFSEAWVRERIEEDPSILGLGDIAVKDVERRQPRAGRLDLLLVDPETNRRYEVELQLGAADESHIIRTIEYWDIERKRYPNYDHCAVIIAENITGRFLNVISLFNSSIPLIAIQMTGLKVGDQLVLQFVKVLDEVVRGEDDEDEVPGGAADRDYWEERGSKASMDVADECVSILREINPAISLKYNKYYIGLAMAGRPSNFVVFRARKQFLKVEAWANNRNEWMSKLEEAGVVVFPGGPTRKSIHFRLILSEVREHHELLKELFETCYKEQQS